MITYAERICQAIKEACLTINDCPDASIQDIFNESLESWGTGLKMDQNFNVEVDMSRKQIEF